MSVFRPALVVASDTDVDDTSLQIDLSTVPAGDGVILWAMQNAPSGSPVLSTSDPSSWAPAPTELPGEHLGGWQFCQYGAWYVAPGDPVPSTVTVNANQGGPMIVAALPVDGAQVAAPMFASDWYRAGGSGITDITVPSVIPDRPGELVVLVANQRMGAVLWGGDLDELFRETVAYTNVSREAQLAGGSEPWPTTGPTGTRLIDFGTPATSFRAYAFAFVIATGPAGPPWTLSVGTDGQGTVVVVDDTGPVDPDVHEWDDQDVATLTATPDPGWTVGSPLWAGPGVPPGQEDANPLLLTMDASKSVTANFVESEDAPDMTGLAVQLTGPTSATVTWDAHGTDGDWQPSIETRGRWCPPEDTP